MKFKQLISVFSVGCLLAAAATSCSSEEPVNNPTTGAISVLKAPKVTAYSGTHTWNTTGWAKPGSRGDNAPDDVVKVQDFREKSDWLKGAHPGFYEWFDNAPQTTDRGESVSTEEYDYVMAYLAAHPDEGATEYDLSTYYLQNVGSAGHQYTTTPDQNGVTHTTGMQMDYFNINGWHVNDYNAQGGPRIYVENWPLTNASYHDSFGNNTFSYYRFYTIPMPDGTYNLYLCFDYATVSQQGDVIPDGVYDDWVIKITPGDGREIKSVDGGSGTQPGEGEGEGNGEGTTCPDCGHATHEGSCSECLTPDDKCNPDYNEGGNGEGGNGEVENPETPETPETPSVDNGRNEVEVNLTVDDKNGDYLESHLSIHVRHATDVDIFIPVTADYVCKADDMEIVQKHLENMHVHGGNFDLENNYAELSYDINGNMVYLKIEILPEGIHIWTEGINEAVIEYCYTTYGDGITFEVWNYYNENTKLDDLKYLLNRSVIKFLDSCPDAYINAFNQTTGGEINPDDCTVSIVEEQVDNFYHSHTGEHLNGSPYNQIYDNKNPSGRTE